MQKRFSSGYVAKRLLGTCRKDSGTRQAAPAEDRRTKEPLAKVATCVMYTYFDRVLRIPLGYPGSAHEKPAYFFGTLQPRT